MWRLSNTGMSSVCVFRRIELLDLPVASLDMLCVVIIKRDYRTSSRVKFRTSSTYAVRKSVRLLPEPASPVLLYQTVYVHHVQQIFVVSTI